MDKNRIYIYCVEYPLREDVYIGSTINPKIRESNHKSEGTRGWQDAEYYRKIKQLKLEINFFILDICSREERYYWENFYMELYKSWGFKLKNIIKPKMGSMNFYDRQSAFTDYERGLYDCMCLINRNFLPTPSIENNNKQTRIKRFILDYIKDKKYEKEQKRIA